MEGNDNRLADVVRASLRQYQMRAKARRAEQQLREIRADLGDALDGDEAEIRDYLLLQANLSSAEKEQQRAKRARTKTAHSPRTVRRHERAKEHRERLASLLVHHPAHSRTLALEREDPDRVIALRRMNKLAAIVEEAQHECDREAMETAEAVRSVLAKLGYVNDQGLTQKARGLREIVAPAGIVLSELYEAGTMDDLNAAELAEMVSWFASDQDRRRDNHLRLTRRLVALRRVAQESFQRIAILEEEEGIDLAQGPSRWFFGVAYAWCRGDSIADITARIDLGEGDIVSILNKTVDLLDQLESMLRVYNDRRTIAVCAEARRMLVRGLVAMVRTSDEVG
jgi:superfamily II RNA helicase